MVEDGRTWRDVLLNWTIDSLKSEAVRTIGLVTFLLTCLVIIGLIASQNDGFAKWTAEVLPTAFWVILISTALYTFRRQIGDLIDHLREGPWNIKADPRREEHPVTLPQAENVEAKEPPSPPTEDDVSKVMSEIRNSGIKLGLVLRYLDDFQTPHKVFSFSQHVPHAFELARRAIDLMYRHGLLTSYQLIPMADDGARSILQGGTITPLGKQVMERLIAERIVHADSFGNAPE